MRNFIFIAAPSETFPFTQVLSATCNCIDVEYPSGWFYEEDYNDVL